MLAQKPATDCLETAGAADRGTLFRLNLILSPQLSWLLWLTAPSMVFCITRQPIHFHTSYTTGPSFVLWKAPTGHADAQAGRSQCMH